VLISRKTALGMGLVTADYLERLLTERIDLERIRRDRILHEALTCDADPLQLALVFGIDHSTAMTYANLARQILATDSEPTASTASVHG
jgi:predicted metal-dependent hydrolase